MPAKKKPFFMEIEWVEPKSKSKPKIRTRGFKFKKKRL